MARNITTNRVMIEGNTVPKSVRVVNFQTGGSVLNVTVVTQTDIYGQKAGGGWEVTGQKPEYHNVVVKGGSDRLADILRERSLFVRAEGALRYREWDRTHRINVNGQWEDAVDGSGKTITISTPVPEIVIGGNNGSEFRIMPCVNSRQDGGQGAHAASRQPTGQNSPAGTSRPPWESPDDDNLGPAFPSEASGMDDVPF